MSIEAVFMLGDDILERRSVNEDLLFSSYRRRRTLLINGKKVVITKCSRIDERYLTECKVEVMETP